MLNRTLSLTTKVNKSYLFSSKFEIRDLIIKSLDIDGLAILGISVYI
jgi:hypothetical protein